MRWGSEKNKAQAIFYWIATAVLILVIIGMSVDFISWRNAIGMIKKQIPTQYSPHALYEGGGMDNLHYTPLWQGKLKGRVYLSMDEDMNSLGDGSFDGVIKGLSGVDFPLKYNKICWYGEGEFKNKTTTKNIQMWVYLLSKGEKTYKQVYKGQVTVDYPITEKIVNKYKSQIDPDKTMKPEDVAWLCTFTHDSLHKYIEGSEGVKPYYAYRLDQIISSQVKWKKVYEKVWTKFRKNACIGIIYKVDKKTYIRVAYNAWRISCHNGGYIFSFWK